MKKTIAIILLTCSSLLAQGCGGTEPATASETTASESAPTTEAVVPTERAKDSCSLVTREDMGVMFGELKEGPAESSGLRNERQCNYMNMDGSWIKLSLYAGKERWEWEKGITNAQSPREVGGLGDEAFAIKRGTDSVVYVRKGESILELSCSCAAETAEAIARVATTKL